MLQDAAMTPSLHVAGDSPVAALCRRYVNWPCPGHEDLLINNYFSWIPFHTLPQINIPLLMLNAGDDALIPVSQNWTPMEFSQISNYAIYAVTKHGGHLWFFEGGFLKANTVSWMDRMLTQYVDATLELNKTLHSNGEVHCNGEVAS